MIYVDYFSRCYDFGCKKELVVPGDYRGLILCPECAFDFKRELQKGFPGGFDKKTYNKFMQKFGNKKERGSRILNEVLKENGIDIDNEE